MVEVVHVLVAVGLFGGFVSPMVFFFSLFLLVAALCVSWELGRWREEGKRPIVCCPWPVQQVPLKGRDG